MHHPHRCGTLIVHTAYALMGVARQSCTAHFCKTSLDVKPFMLRKAVDECAPWVLTTYGPNHIQRMDVIVAPCYERLWFCTPRCHQLWAILWPHFDPCYERQTRALYINQSMLRKAALPGATKYWAILWPHMCLQMALIVNTNKSDKTPRNILYAHMCNTRTIHAHPI